MVGNDDINTFVLCKSDRFDRGRTDVDRDDELHAAFGERLYRLNMESISFPIPMRKVDLETRLAVGQVRVADLLEKVRKECRAGNAVAVEIGIDRDAFVLFDSPQEPCNSFVHSFK